ncbi:hypothetical protein DL95DRAFT_376876 [Leptodontidium sp. 2 PMI_412]|nr:hypothetical protein DL95DRAFT_376876 [Leptodontidium sp. 2 PMI_412]
MVNRGRPSRDCLPCRKRKLRCDLQAQVCGQCQRARILCHGYRKIEDMVFHDETTSTEQKVLARRSLALPSKPAVGPPLSWDTSFREAFFCLYLARFSQSHTSIAPLYSRASVAGPLVSSVDAISLAFAAFQFNSQKLRSLANKTYLNAIQTLSQALCNPKISTSDETLQAVLLLDLCEKFANCHLQNSNPPWMIHIKGAMSLVEARGNRNFSSPIACQLASRVAEAMAISCGSAAVPVPNSLPTLRGNLDGFVFHANWEFAALVVSVASLRADIHSGKLKGEAATDRARELDRSLAVLQENLPRSWKSKRVQRVEQDTHILGHYYDVYPSHAITQTCNAIRMMRLEMNSILREYDQLDSENSASNAIDRIARQICDTIPQFIIAEARPENGLPFLPLQRLHCCSMLPPLYLAAQLSTDEDLRGWISQTMEYMAEWGSLQMARDIADLLKTKSDVDYWTVCKLTGSYALNA